MDDTRSRNTSSEPAPERQPVKTDKKSTTAEMDRRQEAAIEAYLAQQRAAMGFT